MEHGGPVGGIGDTVQEVCLWSTSPLKSLILFGFIDSLPQQSPFQHAVRGGDPLFYLWRALPKRDNCLVTCSRGQYGQGIARALPRTVFTTVLFNVWDTVPNSLHDSSF